MNKTLGLEIKGLAGNASLTLSRQLIAGLLQMISAVIIARILGPEGNGQYAVALLLPSMLATLLNIGIGPANVYYLSSGNVDTATAFNSIIRLTLVLTVFGLTLGAGCIFFFADKWFPDVSELILWSALAIYPFSLLQIFLASIFQGLQKFKAFNLILLVQPTVTFCLILILFLVTNINIKLVIFAYLLANIITVSISLIKVRYEIQKEGRQTFHTNYIRQAISYGYKAHISNILSFVNYKTDIFFVNFFLNPAAAGIYIVAVQIVERLWMLSQSVSTVILPRLSELSKDEGTRKQLTPIICCTVTTITFIAALFLGFLAHPIIIMLFGESYKEAASVLILLLPGIVAGSGARIMANDIAARGRPELNMYFSAVVVTINIIGNIILIPNYGLTGAALATTLAYAVNFLLRLIVYKKVSGNRFLAPILITRNDIHKLINALNPSGHFIRDCKK